MNFKLLNVTSNQPYGILKYAFDKPDAQFISSSLFSSPDDLKTCSREMKKRMDLGKGKVKLAHVILSAHPDDHITPEQWAEMVEAVMQHYGASIHSEDNVLGMAALHRDRHHEHAHLILVLVGADGRMFNRSMERVHLRNIARKFESKIGSTQTPLFSDKPSHYSKPEIEKANRLCIAGDKITPCPERMDLRAVLQTLVPAAHSFSELETVLSEHGICVQYRLNEAGQRTGLSFAQGNVRITGKNAGFNFRKLEEIYGKQDNSNNRIADAGRIAPAPSVSGKSSRTGVGADHLGRPRPPERPADGAKSPSGHHRSSVGTEHQNDRGIFAATQSLFRQVTTGKARQDPLVLLLALMLGHMSAICDGNDRAIRPRRSITPDL